MCIIYIITYIIIIIIIILLFIIYYYDIYIYIYIYIWGTVKMVEDHFSIAGVFCQRYARNTVKR